MDWQQQVKKWVRSIEIDHGSLSSYRYEENPYDLEYPLYLGSGGFEWDEEEEWKAQCKTAIEIIKNEDMNDYIDVNESEETVIEYIRNIA